MALETTEDVEQYIDTMEFLLDKLSVLSTTAGMRQHASLWPMLQDALMYPSTTKRLFKHLANFAETEMAIQLERRKKKGIDMSQRERKSKEASCLTELKKLGIVGNARHDMPLLKAADRLVLQELDLDVCKDIMQWVNEDVMGLDIQEISDLDVTNHKLFLAKEG